MAHRSAPNDPALLALMQAISGGDADQAEQRLREAPALARAALTADASFDRPKAAYVGDTPLHIAAANHAPGIVELLIGLGADVRARNRRGAEPLHSACVGQPGSPVWDSAAQAKAVARLVAAGADPEARNMDGAAPLHLAVRTRSATAVEALLDAGANINARNGSGSTALLLATHTTGRSGSGSVEARALQADIRALLERRGART